MEIKDWESCSEPATSSEDDLQDLSDSDIKENPFLKSGPATGKLQFRKNVSRARWDEDIYLAEVFESKGAMWTTTGIIRNKKLYLFLEETLFLAKIEALLVFDSSGAPLTIMQIAQKLADAKNGCCFKSFMVYKRLKSLGYVVGRHNVPWSMKRRTSQPESSNDILSTRKINHDNESNGEGDATSSLSNVFKDLHLGDLKPTFDVYLPNSKFKKSSPGNPYFLLCLLRDSPPSRVDFERYERESKGIPLKYCHVGGNARVVFFSSYKVELLNLP
ncbi:uncharacterized protein [Aristolochia californica]|uniref:uncharacterized protein n=1 Tax=Aristolochia californica TaxID=171875 RepID=UPI0035D8CD48